MHFFAIGRPVPRRTKTMAAARARRIVASNIQANRNRALSVLTDRKCVPSENERPCQPTQQNYVKN